MPSSQPDCTGEVVLEIMSRDYSSLCSESIPCLHSEYQIEEEYHYHDKKVPGDESMFFLKYNLDKLEETRYSYINVDFLAFFGQIGGLLGITLGWSGINIATIIQPLVKFFTEAASFF